MNINQLLILTFIIFFYTINHNKKNSIYEITASSLNKPGSFAFETDKFLIGSTYPEENYGLLEISANTIEVKLKDKSGKSLNSVKLDY
mgnify:CR=1 FL=1